MQKTGKSRACRLRAGVIDKIQEVKTFI